MQQSQRRLDSLHGCLADQRRRNVLYRLKCTEQPQTLTNLAEYIATQEADSGKSDVDGEGLDEVKRDLYHTHLPKLEDAALVEFDHDERTVTLAEYPEDLIDEAALPSQ